MQLRLYGKNIAYPTNQLMNSSNPNQTSSWTGMKLVSWHASPLVISILLAR
jgi:hypothetical protein